MSEQKNPEVVVQDSVVMGDVTAQTVVHHHHFQSPEQSGKNGVELDSNQYVATYTPLHTSYWKWGAIIAILLALILPSPVVFCFTLPLMIIGIFSLMFQTDIGAQQAGHPEGKRVMSIFLLLIFSFFFIFWRYTATV